jgi:5S rRNA maturation endonuclease (ribonuclease M5)
VNTVRNAWACQSSSCISARQGRIGGNVLDLVSIMEHCSVRDAALRLKDRFGVVSMEPAKRMQSPLAVNPPEPNQPLGFVLRDVDCSHPYLAARGIFPQTARTFGVGFYGGHGLLHGRVVIPIHNERQELVAYAGRAIQDEEPKYRFPAGFRKSQVLFNLNRAVRSGHRNVVVAEGFFDAMKIHQAGQRAVVALMGSTMSDRQTDLLAARFSHAVVVLDGDDAGRRGAGVIASRLEQRMAVTVINLSDGVQPDQLSSKEICGLLGGYCMERRGIGR